MDVKNCTGCTACADACPTGSIEMKPNDEGFLYPRINEGLCISCNKCKEICSLYVPKKEIREFYACASTDNDMLAKSSSGGMFFELAKCIIEKSGAVFGTVLDENLKCKFICAENLEDVKQMQGSKYIQSDIQGTFPQIKKRLSEEQYVMFIGTPCQVNGLRRYLNKDYERLLCVDLICHGVPSQKFFDSYIYNLQKKKKAKIKKVYFRSKDIFGWSHSFKAIVDKKGKTQAINQTVPINSYYWAFMKGLNYRESCYQCNFSAIDRVGDITLGDFWDAGITNINCDISKGVSLVLVNTVNGKKYIEELTERKHIVLASCSKDIAVNSQTHLSRPVSRPETRSVIYKDLNEMGYSYIEKHYCLPPKYVIYKIINMMPIKFRNKLKGRRL